VVGETNSILAREEIPYRYTYKEKTIPASHKEVKNPCPKTGISITGANNHIDNVQTFGCFEEAIHIDNPGGTTTGVKAHTADEPVPLGSDPPVKPGQPSASPNS
jgi:hypothetical protein